MIKAIKMLKHLDVTTYCGARWYRLSDWKLYPLFRKMDGAFSVGPIFVFTAAKESKVTN